MIPQGSSNVTVKKLIAKLDIDTSHFDVKRAMQRNKFSWEFENIFKENSPVPRNAVNKLVRKFNVLGDPKCVDCGIEDEYNGKPIDLQVDHKNGVNTDNRIENLRWMCPNCHSQTLTYKGKNISRCLV